MNIETKLNHMLKLLPLNDSSNKEKLLEDYEEIKKLLNPSFSIKSFPETIRLLKANQFYQKCNLDTDPKIFKAIISKVDDITMIETLLSLCSEITYSEQEKNIFKQRLHILISLSILYGDLNKAAALEESETINNQVNFLEIYFSDFKKLKKMYSYEEITLENIVWFFNSNLFALLSETPDYFDTDLQDLYQSLLESTEINTGIDFITHKNILIGKYKKSQEEKEIFNYDGFYFILKEHFENTIRELPTLLNLNTFYKLPRAATLSPIARLALINNLKKYEVPKPL